MNEITLLSLAKSLAGADHRHAPLVARAANLLKRVAGRSDDPVYDIAMFAAERAYTIDQNAELSKAAQMAESDERVKAALSMVVPGESHEKKLQRIGKAYECRFPLRHRYTSALLAAIDGIDHECHRPHEARDSELFAALGLFLLVCSWSPTQTTPEQFDKHGAQLDAQECIDRASTLVRTEDRAEWKIEFKRLLSTFKLASGKWVPAGQAMALFEKRFPPDKYSHLRLPLIGSFHKPYSEMKRDYDGRAIKHRKTAPAKAK